MPAIATKRSKVIRTSKRRSGKVKDDQVKEKIIVTRIGEVISTRQRYDCNRDRQSDIDEAKI